MRRENMLQQVIAYRNLSDMFPCTYTLIFFFFFLTAQSCSVNEELSGQQLLIKPASASPAQIQDILSDVI